ncbi:hypothetical protein [Borreliella lusitaniae]|uniref:hypothetical protein n=1 Tax=Borreliella lusitaniae TaxID=100177 RepID=UPI00292F2502|nr:hypothetical protein [Borreliella lusitaniae]WNY67329.1 hypothetical protein QIA40_04930 [Borreliella lusitaniae]
MKSKLEKVSNKLLIPALLLIISCNPNMDTNEQNKALNEQKLKNASEVVKNSLKIESDLVKEPEAGTNQNTAPILEVEKIESGIQEFLLKAGVENESLIQLEILEETNLAKTEEEIAKIQEKLLLIGASDEITKEELNQDVQSLHPTTIEFKILSNTPESFEEQEILKREEEINASKNEIFEQREKNSSFSEIAKTPPPQNYFPKQNHFPKQTTHTKQNHFPKQTTHSKQTGNFKTKEYTNKARESLDKALNAIKVLEKSEDFETKNLLKDQVNYENKEKSLLANHSNLEEREKMKNKLLRELERVELIFEDIQDPLGTSTIKQVIDAARKWQKKENLNQINWDSGSDFHPNPTLYKKSLAREYEILAEKFSKVKNEYKNTKEQLKLNFNLKDKNISKIVAATTEFANHLKNLILLVEKNH